MMAPDNMILAMVFSAVFFYVLYGVVRAAVRDGIVQADERRQKARGVEVNSSGEGA